MACPDLSLQLCARANDQHQPPPTETAGETGQGAFKNDSSNNGNLDQAVGWMHWLGALEYRDKLRISGLLYLTIRDVFTLSTIHLPLIGFGCRISTVAEKESKMRLSKHAIEVLAEMVCGSHGTSYGFSWPNFPYRSSYYLTKFFSEDCNLPYNHDGSTRISWVKSVLDELNEGKAKNPELPPDNLIRVIHELLESVRFKMPENYQGALDDINRVLSLKDGLQVRLVQGHCVFSKVKEPFEFVDSHNLKKCLEDFAHYIAAEKRMSFWEYDQTQKKNKWRSQPEKFAKDLLHTYLDGRFGQSIHTFEEIASGAGRIDIFILLTNGEKAVVELKMCGNGYSFSYAEEGTEQLIHYMENKDARIGYLVVFDSRTRDFSEGFQGSKTINGMTVVTLVADTRPYVKQKDALTYNT